jgi:hypothetical protein
MIILQSLFCSDCGWENSTDHHHCSTCGNRKQIVQSTANKARKGKHKRQEVNKCNDSNTKNKRVILFVDGAHQTNANTDDHQETPAEDNNTEEPTESPFWTPLVQQHMSRFWLPTLDDLVVTKSTKFQDSTQSISARSWFTTLATAGNIAHEPQLLSLELPTEVYAQDYS